MSIFNCQFGEAAKQQFVGLLSYADKHFLLFGVESVYNAVPEAGGEELAKKVQKLIK